MKDNVKTIKLMAKEHINLLKDIISIKENGWKI